MILETMEPPEDQHLPHGTREFVIVKSSPDSEEVTPASLERRTDCKLMEMTKASDPPEGQHLPPASGSRNLKFVMVKSSPEEVTPAALERRRKLMEMTKASFPNGVPDPFTIRQT